MKKVLLLTATAIALFSCKKDTNDTVAIQFRTPVSYSSLDTTVYTPNFKDSKGDSTVNRIEGRNYNQLFVALAAYIKTSVDSTRALNVSTLNDMFTNTNSPFTGAYAYLNATGLQLDNVTASSLTSSQSSAINADLKDFFARLVAASNKVADTASQHKAGKLWAGSKKYLVDTAGIEWGQVIQKALIGTYQIDYIGNKLLTEAANNSQLVSGTNSTQRELNWDKAYGVLTVKNVYGSSATISSSGESQLGAYAWEYNPYNPKANKALTDIHKSFVMGRAAIINNDGIELNTQANNIRRTFEKAIASAAIGYLEKWKTLTTDAEKAHALGEGLGFIYSLRICKLHGATVAFSDDIFDELINTGYWNLTVGQVNAAESKIKNQFGL